jgi:aryl-alcohol dehydrogenase-like predicted oxidoreductase
MTKIGLGMAALGRLEYINIREEGSVDKSEEAFRRNSFLVMNEAYKNGVRFFDTAPSYGKGEEFLIDWNASNKFEDVVLSTKWGYTYVANWELGFKGSHEVKEHSLEKLVEQWEASKTLLPKLDVYQIHSATFESGVLKNTSVLKKLCEIKQETGLKIGLTVSGANQKEILKEAMSISIDNQLLFDSFQVTYNVYEQGVCDILKEIKESGRFVIIKEGLANGRVFVSEENILKKLSIKYNVGIDAIALRFCIDTVNPDIVLSGASNTKQLNENLKALSFQLTLGDIEELKKIKVHSIAYWKSRSQLSWG